MIYSKIKKSCKALRENSYVMQIATLMTGTLVAQVLMLIFIPILTRLYTPAEFGAYSFFFSIVSIVGLVSSFKYDQAVMLPKKQKDAISLVLLSVLLTALVTTICVISLIFLHELIEPYFDGEKLYVWLIPIGIAIIGFQQIATTYASRQQLYKQISTTRVVNSLSVISSQIASKSIFNFNGLIVGKLFSDLLSLSILVRYNVVNTCKREVDFSYRRMKVNASRYHHFPKYQSLTVFVNSLSQNAPVLMLAALYSAEVAGFYALTIRVLQAPISLVGSATKEVFFQKASKLYSNGEDFFDLYKKTTLGLLRLFILPLFIVIIFGEDIFSFIFGDEWADSGKLAQILICWFLFLFINSPSIQTFSILCLQKVQMKFEFASVFMRVAAIYIGFYFFDSFIVSVFLFSLVSVMTNFLIMIYIFYTLKNRSGVAC